MKRNKYIAGDLKKETCEDIELLYLAHLENLAEEGTFWHDFSEEDKARAIALFRVAYQDGWLLTEDELNVEEDFRRALEERRQLHADSVREGAWEVRHIFGDDDHAEVELK